MAFLGFLGIGRGKMKVQLDNMQFSPGETITGKLVINLKRPIKGKAVLIGLLGEQKITEFSGGKRQTRTQKIFDFNQPLSGEKDYMPGEQVYDFQLKIPTNLNQNTAPTGALGNVVKAAQMFSNKTKTIKWYVTGRLDCPGIDMTKKVQITVS
jgi:hypothetical protein